MMLSRRQEALLERMKTKPIWTFVEICRVIRRSTRRTLMSLVAQRRLKVALPDSRYDAWERATYTCVR